LIDRTRQLEQQRLADLASVTQALQDAMSALGAEMTAWHGDVQQAAGRCDALISEPDPERLRTRLIDEVRTLRQVVVDRRRRWDATTRAYAERVTTLEGELQSTRTQAETDPLTGLANRRAFDRDLQRRLQARTDRIVLALFDVDDFKGVNDRRGPAEGDRVLTAIASMLSSSIRPGDLAARLGGDEFALICGGVTARQAEHRFSTIVSEISVAVHGVSCGLTELAAGDTPASLYARADGALYDAKAAGKHRVGVRSAAYVTELRAVGGRRATL
jgi:diguanylate cyclase (GGDEF)-like protein